MRRAVWIGLLLAMPSSAFALPRGADGVALRDAASAMHELRIEEAGAAIDRLALEHADDPDVRFERAMVRFYRGDYAGAVSDLDAAGDQGSLRTPEDRATLADLIRATREATRSFVTVRSSDGRYLVQHAPGPDALLVPYAFEALERADRALSAEIGVRLPGPIRLEIYPSAASLAQVSSLTVQDIETTGTIALCKWDRLMVTSPRALVRGYPWMDTIAHESVHLFLARASRDEAPVWFQEGVAKFLERRWREEQPAAHLDPTSELLLRYALTCPARPQAPECQVAVATGTASLLPFERLHPSIARLDSQEQAALAFAQVATFIEQFYGAHGRAGLQRAIRQTATGTDAREALAAVAGTTFAELERGWRAALAARPSPDAGAPPRVLHMRLRHDDGPVDESAEIDNERARRFVRLGDLLWDRDRAAAASVEYGRAHDIVPDDPIVAARFARAALVGGRPAEAIRALAPSREHFEEHEPTWAVSGAAWLALGDLPAAAEALRSAIRLNPFDPDPHCDLAEASADADERRREREVCEQVGGGRRR
ncbi:MAG: hypothetical protein H6719_03355 [Sandaracinaceae bacterium]|nr:hypothetical protein [Sandaracinaceae bacterium]